MRKQDTTRLLRLRIFDNYYGLTFLIIILMNAFLVPMMQEQKVQEVGYDVFMQKTDDGDIGDVQIADDHITFTDKDGKNTYKTGLMNDPQLIDRLYKAKENLAEIVTYLHDPKKYRDIGANIPKGILLVGPPGTGKTMLAKALAGESGVPFFSISGSEFVEMFVGMGASKVRDLFKQAKEKAPCIVFIDEIDAIGEKRIAGQVGGNDEREQTLNQLLTEMDGFESNIGVIILAATNRPDSLDPALTRPGRFDRRIPVELPDLAGREAILKVHAKKVRMAEGIDYGKIARMSSGAPVQKITIIPRTSGALGYTMQVDTGNHYLYTKEELKNKIATLTGGRSAEEIVFGTSSTGAAY